MAKLTKKQKSQGDQVDREKLYGVDEAISLAKTLATSKFDETIEVALNLGVDPRHADQMVRGVVNLPKGTGKDVRVAVFAKGDKAEEARKAGADVVGAEDLMETIQGGTIDFDRVIATPDMMGKLARLGKVLGPRGLMPNPKTGTVTKTQWIQLGSYPVTAGSPVAACSSASSVQIATINASPANVRRRPDSLATAAATIWSGVSRMPW